MAQQGNPVFDGPPLAIREAVPIRAPLVIPVLHAISDIDEVLSRDLRFDQALDVREVAATLELVRPRPAVALRQFPKTLDHGPEVVFGVLHAHRHPGAEASALQRSAVEEAGAPGAREVHRGSACSCRLAENGDAFGIAAEGRSMSPQEAENFNLVQKAHVPSRVQARHLVRVAAEALGAQKAEHAEPVVEGDHYDITEGPDQLVPSGLQGVAGAGVIAAAEDPDHHRNQSSAQPLYRRRPEIEVQAVLAHDRVQRVPSAGSHAPCRHLLRLPHRGCPRLDGRRRQPPQAG
mmetsp:Transcript_44621/g.142243  ORF Transcript_44621/g.142243 Transcript_44621/m.142243 type:complete len:291 (+) Transcript_44621:1034-1906(+)